jgi:hypothetical protein
MKNCIVTILCVVVLSVTAVSAEKDLLRTENGLHEKLIVTDNNAVFHTKPEMQAKAENASAFSIFWRLKTDTPNNEKGVFYRIGDPDGNEIGWIDKKCVTPWRTRFCLQPTPPQTDGRFFSIKTREGVEIKFIGEAGKMPDGYKRLAFITKSADNENEEAELDVVVFTGNTESNSGVDAERNAIANMELDVVFLIDTTISMTPMIEMVKEITHKTAESLAKNENIRDIVHFGIVEYRDKDCAFTSKVTCKLDSTYDQFKTVLSNTKVDKTNGDIPEELVEGLRSAIKDAGWRNNSSKHIILLGDAPAKEPDLKIFKDEYPNISKEENLDSVMGSARSRSGSDSQRMLTAKNVHAVMNDHQPIIDKFCNKLKEEGLEQKTIDIYRELMTNPNVVKKVVTDENEFYRGLLDKGIDEATADEFIAITFRNALFEECGKICKKQFLKLTQNQNEFQGFFQVVNTYKNDGSKDKAVSGLIEALEESFKALENVRTGKTGDVKQTMGASGAISQGIYQIISTNAPPDLLKKVTWAGVAKGRDKNGRLVAEKKIMVMKEELWSFSSTMDLLHTNFKSKSDKADRQDVSQILKTLTESIARVASGEKMIDEGMKLDKILEFDFPFKTPALSVSARDIAVMTTPAFNSWLEQLHDANKGARKLLTSGDWKTLNNHFKQECTFLKLSELP